MSRFRTPGRLIAAGLAIGLVAASGSLLASSAPAQAAELPDAQRWAPSRLPDRITLTPGENPATEQVIAWRSSTAVTDGIVQYRTLTPEPYPGGILSLTAQERHEQTTDLGYTQVTHTATLSGLVPGTAYMYRVGDGTNFSEWQDFETATAEGGNYSFIYLGDVQNGILDDASRVIRNAFRDRPNADLVVQAGDLVNDAHSDAQWGEVYEAFSYTLGTQNLLTTPGNHEYDGVLSSQYRNQFAFPDNGPAGDGAVYDALEGTVYYVDYENTRFVTLNSNVTDTEGLAVQRAWLESVLTDNPQTWTVVMFHHPVYSLDEGRNNLGIRQSWGPLFEQYNVDLVLTGHDHAYGRGNTDASEQNLPEGADPDLSHTGPVYVTSSVGSKFYTAGPRHWNENDAHLRRLVQGMQTYQLVDVTSGSLRFESRTADGAFLDGFTITKQDGQKLVVDGVEPQVIDPGDPGTCLGCGENPDPDPVDPGEEVPSGDFAYEATGSLVSVTTDMARLPAGVAYHEGRDVLYLGDQNGKSIFEVDPQTDAVLRTITLPENIRDLGIDEQRELLYVGQQNRNWTVVSIADANFGEVVRGSYPIIESNRSLDVDPVNDYVYVAVPSRGVEVFRASTGESLGVVNGTGDAYYVAADPATGMIVTTKFYDVEGAIGIQAFDASNGFVKVWERSVRPGARQVDIDSTNGLLYIGYTGTDATSGGFSVHDLKTGALHVDMVGATYGKDGYGITVDEEHQRVFVANRDFRLNPPGDETTPAAVTVSTRVLPEAYDYAAAGSLVSVTTDMARLPAGVAYHEGRDVLYLGDQNGKSIFEVDPQTDAVLRTITLPENIRDLGIDEQRELLYVGQQNRNWTVVSIADANFGEVVRGSYPIIESNRSLDVDPVNDYVYVAVPSRGVEVFRASTGESLGVVNGTGDAYYVAADPATGMIVTTKFYDVEGAIGIQAFDASNGFVKVWERSVRPGARQVDIDSTNGLLYIGYTGTDATSGGFSVHDLKTGALHVDMVGATYGKDGYGITVDEEHQRVFVANRDFRLNPPGDETTPAAVTVSTRVLDDAGEPGDGGSGDGGSGDGGSGDGGSGDGGSGAEAWTATALTSLPVGGTDMGENPDIRPVGSVVDPETGYIYLADEMRPARVHVIDPATDTVVRVMTAPTGDPVEDGLRDIALDPEKGWLYVAYSGNWIVMDAETGERVAGPYSLSGSARGMDIDVDGGRLFAATRGTGFEVRDLTTGDLVTKVEGPTDAGAWRSHGIAYDTVNDLIYVSNSDTDGSTEGIRVYSGTDYTLQRSLAYDGADFRSIAVDGEAGIVVVGHQSITFDDSGASVYAAADLSLIKRLSEYQYGNKVYGVSIDPDRDLLYVSARERYPAALIAVTLGNQ